MLEISLLLFLALLLTWPLGRYMKDIFSGQPHFSDHLFLPFERLCYRILGIDASRGMTGPCKPMWWPNPARPEVPVMQ